MPRFDKGVVNSKLEKGDIVLMGNPTQYGEILADNIFVEDILRVDLQTLISGNNLVRGKFYRITNAVGSTLSLLVQGLTANTICDYAYNTANGDLVAYNISSDVVSVPFTDTYVPYTGANNNVNLGSNSITANAIIKSSGTSGQFLKADGSVDSNNYLTTISGINAGGELSGTYPNPSLVTSSVTGKALTGLSVSGSAVVSTDSILTGIGKLQNQINAVMGSVNFQGTWNASTNTPTLASGVGTKGYYYIVTVAGSTNLDGITDWKLGDWAIYDGTAWQKVDNTDAVVSVNGYTGIVTLAKADIGLGNVENTALSTWAGSSNITTLGTIGTGVWQGTAIADAYISSAATWNAKIGGSGTSGYIPKFTASGTVGDSVIRENSGNIGIGVNPTNAKLEVVATTDEVFRADASGGALRVVVNQDGVLLGGVTTLTTTPTTSASTFDLITRNTSTGVLEKVASNYYATAGSISGTTGKLAKFTSSGAVGDSIVSESGTEIILGGTALVATDSVYLGYFGKSNVLVSGTSASDTAIFTPNNFNIGTGGSNILRFQITSGGQIITNTATDTGEAHIFGGSARVNGDFKATGSVINFSALPTSSAGLSAGDIWNDGGTLKIV